jgi:hypothetical protein
VICIRKIEQYQLPVPEGQGLIENRMRLLEEQVDDRLHQIERRVRVYQANMQAILQEREVVDQRLKLMPMSYTGERTRLITNREALGREARTELRSFVMDTARFQKEALETRMDLQGLADTFKVSAITWGDERE